MKHLLGSANQRNQGTLRAFRQSPALEFETVPSLMRKGVYIRLGRQALPDKSVIKFVAGTAGRFDPASNEVGIRMFTGKCHELFV